MMDSEVERDFARYRFSNGLRELSLIVPTNREAIVALASKSNRMVMVERAFLIIY